MRPSELRLLYEDLYEEIKTKGALTTYIMEVLGLPERRGRVLGRSRDGIYVQRALTMLWKIRGGGGLYD